MNQNDILDAALAYVGKLTDPEYHAIISASKENQIDALRAHVRGDDRAGLFLPVKMLDAGQEHLGCILTLQDRAILAWNNGKLFRRKDWNASISYGEITSVERGTRDKLPASVLRVSTRTQTLEMAHHKFDGPGRHVVDLLVGVLRGDETVDALTELLRDRHAGES